MTMEMLMNNVQHVASGDLQSPLHDFPEPLNPGRDSPNRDQKGNSNPMSWLNLLLASGHMAVMTGNAAVIRVPCYEIQSYRHSDKREL